MLTLAPLHPVISPVPATEQGLTGKEKVVFLSRFARKSLILSALKSNVALGRMDKDAQGAPLPCNGVYWSISHKSTCVAGVVATVPVGIDVERIRPLSSALYDKIADSDEWQLGGQKADPILFFRYWTAKEAVLKAAGVGLKALSACHIDHIMDERVLRVRYENQAYLVEQQGVEGHLVSVVKNDRHVTWHVVEHLDKGT